MLSAVHRKLTAAYFGTAFAALTVLAVNIGKHPIS